MAENGDYGLLLAFDADGDFVRGFEAGRLWTQLQDPEEHETLIGQALHATNAEMILRMGEALDLEIAAEPQDETWITITSILEAVSVSGDEENK
jgi:hypothetical protein